MCFIIVILFAFLPETFWDRKASSKTEEVDFATKVTESKESLSVIEISATDDVHPYVAKYRNEPAKTLVQNLSVWPGRLSQDNWFKVAIRPFVLYAYPSVLWSTLVYSLSIGWLIVLSESLSAIYENPKTYGFTPLRAGLVYVSAFIGAVLGTAVAGKASDFIVRSMARRNNGIYEPEFRLIMGIPVAITTAIGLMGYGWAAQVRAAWIVPTSFFGLVSFGCSLGSTTSITFCVDSYRQYAGEALVTLNFSKSEFSQPEMMFRITLLTYLLQIYFMASFSPSSSTLGCRMMVRRPCLSLLVSYSLLACFSRFLCMFTASGLACGRFARI